MISTAGDPPPSAVGPSIAVVIPLYNGAKFIRHSLTSVLRQTREPQEIIVVDDGSTDDGAGAAIVEEMGQQRPITLLHKPNGGQSSARNFGVDHAKSDLIALLDQDDTWYPQHLEELVEAFEHPFPGPELGWVYSDVDEIDEQGQMVTRSYLRTMPAKHPKTDLREMLCLDMYVVPSASLILRSAYQEIGGFDDRLAGYEDDDFFLRLFRAGYGNEFLETALTQWRLWAGSSTHTDQMRQSRAIYLRKLIDIFPDDPARNRFYRRDMLLQRFYPWAWHDYRKAVMSGDMDRIIATHREVAYVMQFLPKRSQRMIGRLMQRMESTATIRAVFAARHVLRPIAKRLLISK